MTQTLTAFVDNLKELPDVSHLAGLSLIDDEEKLVACIENRAGSAGSLRVYHHLAKIFGAITPEAAAHGLALYAEHVEDARQNPGKHPNIDRLIGVEENSLTLRVQHIYALCI